MAAPNDIVGYQYHAADYCARDIIEAMIRGGIAAPAARDLALERGLEATLDELADAQAIARENESSFDSGDFPKVLFRDQLTPGDAAGDMGDDEYANRCETCGAILTAEPAIPWRAAADYRREIDQFLAGYMECAVWSSTDPDTEAPLDDKYSAGDIDVSLQRAMRQECAAFVSAQYADLQKLTDLTGRDMGSHGHDLWLTRNGHGAGYWDRYMEAPKADREQAEQVGKLLTEAAKQLGERDLMPEGDQLVSMY